MEGFEVNFAEIAYFQIWILKYHSTCVVIQYSVYSHVLINRGN